MTDEQIKVQIEAIESVAERVLLKTKGGVLKFLIDSGMVSPDEAIKKRKKKK